MENATDKNDRIAPRHRVLKGAKIVMDDWTNYDCKIRDLSETGAKLLCENGHVIPDNFRLMNTSENTIRPATVVWRKAQSIGVAFTGEIKRAPARKF